MAKDILVVQVGNNERPASENDMKLVEKRIKKALKSSGDTETIVLAFHNAVNMYKLSSLDYDKTNTVLQLFDKGLINAEEVKSQLC